jgi:hypothetical protein
MTPLQLLRFCDDVSTGGRLLARRRFLDLSEAGGRVRAWSLTGTVLVAFRGSGSEDPAELAANAVDDLSAALDPHPRGGRAHRGFLRHWSRFRPAVVAALAASGTASAVLTGFSLGGAVAALAGIDVSLAGVGDVRVVSFASPAPGDAALAAALLLRARVTRYVLRGDALPRLPGLPGYAQPGEEVLLRGDGPDLAAEHSRAAYAAALAG